MGARYPVAPVASVVAVGLAHIIVHGGRREMTPAALMFASLRTGRSLGAKDARRRGAGGGGVAQRGDEVAGAVDRERCRVWGATRGEGCRE